MVNALQRLLRWIRALVRRDAKPKESPRIKREWRSPWGVLYLLVRNTPEAVEDATYRFYPAYIRGVSLLLTCDQYRPVRISSGSNRRSNLQGIRNGTPTAQQHPIPSHRLSLTRLTTTTGFTAVDTEILWSYPVDFIGIKVFGDAGGDRYAKIITAELAMLLLRKEYEQINWEQQIHLLALKWVGSNHEILERK